jgi:carboxylesterase type B
MAAAGYRANNGLHDQRLGLKWIRKHIAGFNGDPERVTFMGESSGAGKWD